MQEGILFHSLNAPGSGVYVTQVVCTLKHLDTLAFEKSWQQVVDHHQILRTAFTWKNAEKSLQVVGRQVKFVAAKQDWHGLLKEQQKKQLDDYLSADRAQGFEAKKAPLMRLVLFQLDDDSYTFVWSHHHLLLDGWSVFLVLKDVLQMYESTLTGRSPALPPARPYRDYIAWLLQQPLSSAESFWRNLLKGFTSPTNIRPDLQPRPAATGRAFQRLELSLSERQTLSLQSFARRHQLTLNTLLQGAWALLLSRYSAASDVVFGAAVPGRPADLAGVEQMVGLFINTLPVRVQIQEELSVSEYLKRIQEQQAEARQYDYTPLAQAQRWSELPRGTALFDSILVFENYPVDASLGNYSSSLKIVDAHAVEQTNYP